MYQDPALTGKEWTSGSDRSLDMSTPKPKQDWGLVRKVRDAASGADSSAPRFAADSEQQSGNSPAAKVKSPKREQQRQTEASRAAGALQSDSSPRSSLNDHSPPSAAAYTSASSTTKLPEPAEAQKPNAAMPASIVRTAAVVSSTTPGTQMTPVDPQPEAHNQRTLKSTNKVPYEAFARLRAPLPAGDVRWSRNFLAGKTALKPEYEDVHGVATTKAASAQLLRASQEFFFYPLSGPGGRLAVHPVVSKGRLPTHAPTLSSGSDIVDFVLDPFDPKRAYLACSDGKIHVFDVPAETSGDLAEATSVLSDGMDKLFELQPHPAIKSLLLSVSDDKGSTFVRVWNAVTADVICKIRIPGGGVSVALIDTMLAADRHV